MQANSNETLAKSLSALRDYLVLSGGSPLLFALNSAIKIIKSSPSEITIDNYKSIKFKPKIAALVLEFISTGRIGLLEKYNADEHTQSLVSLTTVLGVGPATAEKWIKKHGIKNTRDLMNSLANGKIKLTAMQTLGLRYYHDLHCKIPRHEVESIGTAVIEIIASSIDIKCEIVGSYRRGASESSDIDILATSDASTMDVIRKNLEAHPHYIAVISFGMTRFSFLWKGTKVRQVDILWTPKKSYIFALIYFTGSWDFNEAMRSWAKQRSCKLNHIELRCVKNNITTYLSANSEKDVFDALGLIYVDPQNRIGWHSIVRSN